MSFLLIILLVRHSCLSSYLSDVALLMFRDYMGRELTVEEDRGFVIVFCFCTFDMAGEFNAVTGIEPSQC